MKTYCHITNRLLSCMFEGFHIIHMLHLENKHANILAKLTATMALSVKTDQYIFAPDRDLCYL